MRPGERLTAEVLRQRRQPTPQRNWPLMRRLGGAAATLLIASLIVGEGFDQPRLEALCFFTGIGIGVIMMVYAFDCRLFVVKSGESTD